MKYSGALIPPALRGLRNHMASAPFQLSLALMLHGAEGGTAHQFIWKQRRLSAGLAAEFTLKNFSSLGCSERWRATLQRSHTIVWGIIHSSGSATSLYSQGELVLIWSLYMVSLFHDPFDPNLWKFPYCNWSATSPCCFPARYRSHPLFWAAFSLIPCARQSSSPCSTTDCPCHVFGAYMFWAVASTLVLDISGWKSADS